MHPSYDLKELATKSEYYLNEVDLTVGEFGFLKLDRDAYRRSAFMDHRVRSDTQDPTRASLTEVQETVRGIQGTARLEPVNYILHTAFCCSTLLTRCLDIEGASCALREPSVLMQLANYKRTENPYFTDDVRWRAIWNTVVFLLAKFGGDHEIRLIKPTNAANNLAEEVICDPRTGGVLLLYSGLDQFLISIIKKGEECRAFVRRLFNVIRKDTERTRSLPVESLTQLTDLQTAAFVWYLQMDAYLKLLDRFPDSKIRTLDCDTFLAEPLETLAKLCSLFGIRTSTEKLEEIVSGPAFTTYSKSDDRDYDSSIREAEYAEIWRTHHAVIKGIREWSDQIRPEGPIRLPLSRAL